VLREKTEKVNRRTFHKLAGLAGADLFIGHRAFAAAMPSRTQSNAGAGSRGLGDRYLLGAAYYPEWWPAAEWETDFREMQELGINTARMGEFAWAMFEPAPGKFTFDWMDRAIEIAVRYGVRAVLGTPTASIPPWLYEQYPDVLSGNQQGLYTYGGRKGYNTNSTHYLDACSRIVTALADHYGKNSGVIGWQLDNEPGNPFQEYDPVTETAFQEWLKKRYGTLDELNRVWNGAFWSNEFSAWSQIKLPINSGMAASDQSRVPAFFL
jgi:beta-galactosidase